MDVQARTAANVLLAAGIALALVAVAADAADALSDALRAAVGLGGLALLTAAQAIRAYLDRSPRPLLVLALVVGLLAFLVLTRS
jgi:hypothetical protein